MTIARTYSQFHAWQQFLDRLSAIYRRYIWCWNQIGSVLMACWSFWLSRFSIIAWLGLYIKTRYDIHWVISWVVTLKSKTRFFRTRNFLIFFGIFPGTNCRKSIKGKFAWWCWTQINHQKLSYFTLDHWILKHS